MSAYGLWNDNDLLFGSIFLLSYNLAVAVFLLVPLRKPRVSRFTKGASLVSSSHGLMGTLDAPSATGGSAQDTCNGSPSEAYITGAVDLSMTSSMTYDTNGSGNSEADPTMCSCRHSSANFYCSSVDCSV